MQLGRGVQSADDLQHTDVWDRPAEGERERKGLVHLVPAERHQVRAGEGAQEQALGLHLGR